MLAILHPNTALDSEEYRQTMHYLENLPNVSVRVHEVQGATQRLTEIYLLGDTKPLNKEEIEALPAVERAIRISDDYRILGRHRDDRRQSGFNYNGVEFSQSNLNIFAGLCAVDVPEHVDMMMQALEDHGEVCTRMGAYKPRYIYIHGTPEERRIGQPVSYGCIRMRSADVIDLYNRVGTGAEVIVRNEPLHAFTPPDLPQQPAPGTPPANQLMGPETSLPPSS